MKCTIILHVLMFSIFRHVSLVGIDSGSQAIRQLIISAGELLFVSISGSD